MKKIPVLLLTAAILLMLMGCNQVGLTGKQPPKVSIKVSKNTYETKLGSYCWRGTCADMAGPLEVIKDQQPVHVKPGAVIAFVMDYQPKPNKLVLTDFNGENPKEIGLKKNQTRFNAPKEKGIYFYSYDVWWMDKNQTNTSHADASYVFAIEVAD